MPSQLDLLAAALTQPPWAPQVGPLEPFPTQPPFAGYPPAASAGPPPILLGDGTAPPPVSPSDTPRPGGFFGDTSQPGRNDSTRDHGRSLAEAIGHGQGDGFSGMGTRSGAQPSDRDTLAAAVGGLVDDRGDPYVANREGMGISYSTPRSAMANPGDFLGMFDPTGVVAGLNEIGYAMEPDRIIGTLGNARKPLVDYRGIPNANGVPQTSEAMGELYGYKGTPSTTPVAMPQPDRITPAPRPAAVTTAPVARSTPVVSPIAIARTAAAQTGSGAGNERPGARPSRVEGGSGQRSGREAGPSGGQKGSGGGTGGGWAGGGQKGGTGRGPK